MLEVKHVHTRYGKVECLKGISLRIERGEIVALLGANGAGKTTVLKTLSGLIRPVAGEILLEDERIDGLSPEAVVSRGMAHVPEGRKIFQKLTVLENLELGAYLRKDARGIRSDLEHVYHVFPVLKARSAQRAGTLSGGEQQMLAMARALMSRPKILLLDEPSLGLAPIFVSAIFRMIQEINREGRTIFLVEQNARMALKVASRAYVLEIGEIVLQGEAERIRNSPEVQSAYLGGG